MRIFFILGEDSFFKPKFVESIIKKRRKDIVGVAVVPAKTPKTNSIKYLKKQLALFGYWNFFVLGIQIELYKFFDRISKFFPIKRFYSVKSVVKKYGLLLLLPRDINDSQFLERLRKTKPDIIVSSCPQIFKKELLSIPRFGCINRHTSLLPQYGGLMPVFWAMLNDEKEIGVTMHKMNEGIDEGQIITQKKIYLSEGDSLYGLYKKCFEISSGLVLEAIEIIEKKKKFNVINKNKERTYHSFPKKEDVKLFRKKSKKFL